MQLYKYIVRGCDRVRLVCFFNSWPLWPCAVQNNTHSHYSSILCESEKTNKDWKKELYYMPVYTTQCHFGTSAATE